MFMDRARLRRAIARRILHNLRVGIGQGVLALTTTAPQDEPAVLDARGLYCPEPVMLLHARVNQLQQGDRLQILATDPSTLRDIARFCRHLGHELLDTQETGQEGDVEYRFLIRVAGRPD